MTGFTAFILLLCWVGPSFAYEVGKVYKYSYDTSVIVNEKCGFEGNPKAVGHKVKGNVHLTAIWQNQQNSKQKLIKIQILNPKLLVPKKTSFEDHASDLDKVVDSTSYLLWEDGSAIKIWEDPNESASIRNLKRGIATLLQLKNKDERTKEDDVSGNCDVENKVRGKLIRKRKGNCVHSKFDKTLSQPNGVRSAAVQHQSTTDCELEDENSRTISKCSVSEYVKTFSNTWHKPSLCINSKLEFSVVGTEGNRKKYTNSEIEGVIEELKKNYEGGLEDSNLESLLFKNEEKKKNLKTLVTKLAENLKTENLAEFQSASAFYRLLPVFRAASKADIIRILKEEKFEEIRPQILDLVSACGTLNSLEAAFEYFADEKAYNEQLERFIISLAIMPRLNGFVLKQLMSFMKGSLDKKIEASVLGTLGTLLKTYSENHAIEDRELVEEVREYLEKRLKKCSDSSDTCTLNYLRALRNAAQPRSAPVFLEYAQKGGKIALQSVLALRRIPDRLLPPETQKKLLNVFNQVGSSQDQSTRGIAFELILRQHPEPAVLKQLLKRTSDQTDEEFSTYLSSKVVNMMSWDSELRKSVNKVIPEVFDFNFGTQPGQSSVFTRHMISIEGTNATYGLESEMLEGGLLKRSVFDVSFENAAGGSSLLSVGIFAEGLGGFVGAANSDENADPTAGMELGFLGSSLRPYVFFKGTSELMSHAWSGTASDQTPVLQCILAFSDDEKIVVLTNGMVVRGQLRGALSIDTSASIKISLWNRNSQSLVQNEGAILVRGSVSVDAGFVTTQGAIQFSGESGIDFKTDLDFYESPFTLCLQMEHPDIAVKFNVHRSTAIPGTKYQIKRTKKRTIKIPGRSFALNEKNNEMCHALKSNN